MEVLKILLLENYIILADMLERFLSNQNLKFRGQKIPGTGSMPLS